MSQVLAVGCGENSQRCAAFRACPAKYGLGPAFFSFAAVTLPDGSASTRTVILIVPVIVLREFREMSGRTWWTTSPCDASAPGAGLRSPNRWIGLRRVCGLRTSWRRRLLAHRCGGRGSTLPGRSAARKENDQSNQQRNHEHGGSDGAAFYRSAEWRNGRRRGGDRASGGLQSRLDLGNRAAPLRVEMETFARNAAKRLGNRLRQIGIVQRTLLGERHILRERGDKSNAHGPYVARGRDNSGSGFGSVIGVTPPALRIHFCKRNDLIRRKFQLLADGQHVRGLDAPVHKSFPVQIRKRVQNRGEQIGDLGRRQGPLRKNLR